MELDVGEFLALLVHRGNVVGREENSLIAFIVRACHTHRVGIVTIVILEHGGIGIDCVPREVKRASFSLTTQVVWSLRELRSVVGNIEYITLGRLPAVGKHIGNCIFIFAIALEHFAERGLFGLSHNFTIAIHAIFCH